MHRKGSHALEPLPKNCATVAPPGAYSGSSATDSTPMKDRGVLLRFFERAYIVHLSGGADDASFVELIGRHAGWWNSALKLDDSKARKGLKTLGIWADGQMGRWIH